MSGYRCARLASLVILLALASCHSTPAGRTSATSATGAAARSPQTATPAAVTHYVIDPQRSDVRVLVYRDGPMGHLGHNHVIAVRSLSGTASVSSDLAQTSFELTFPVDALSVDDVSLRAEEGADFSTTLDEAAVTGTRDHMLGAALLNSASYPTIHLQSEQLHQAADGLHIMTAMTVRTVTADVDVPVSNWHADDQGLQVSGEFDLTHSQLGLTPYSVALGALRVAERMHVRFRLVASPAPP
jgi:polyisoprenoid-binding protein YceI